jgi:hypothetical protein
VHGVNPNHQGQRQQPRPKPEKWLYPTTTIDTGKPTAAKATARACEMPRIQAIMAAKTPAKVDMIMAKEG